mgnify:CR=1 FL=1
METLHCAEVRRMRTLSVREFKGLIGRLIKQGEEVVVTFRGKPVARFCPLSEDELEKERERLGMELVGIGQSEGGRVSEEHDAVLYSQ